MRDFRASILRAAPRLIRAGSALLLFLAVSGCAIKTESAALAAQEFHRALSASDWTAACALLQPATREKAEEQDGASCEAALQALALPAPGSHVASAVYGREALVEFDNDTVFLAASGAGWRVTAAGCSPREQKPYSCRIEGP